MITAEELRNADLAKEKERVKRQQEYNRIVNDGLSIEEVEDYIKHSKYPYKQSGFCAITEKISDYAIKELKNRGFRIIKYEFREDFSVGSKEWKVAIGRKELYFIFWDTDEEFIQKIMNTKGPLLTNKREL